MDIAYITGDATEPVATSKAPRVIVHCCNDIGGWGAGFVLALSKKWKKPEYKYRSWFRDPENGFFASGSFGLGEIQLINVEHGLFVCNLIGQHGIHARGGVPPIRYEAIASGLEKLNAKGFGSVHMPRMGCGLAGGTWGEIEKIIDGTIRAEVYVYTLPHQVAKFDTE